MDKYIPVKRNYNNGKKKLKLLIEHIRSISSKNMKTEDNVTKDGKNNNKWIKKNHKWHNVKGWRP